jgi:hypothetical protein
LAKRYSRTTCVLLTLTLAATATAADGRFEQRCDAERHVCSYFALFADGTEIRLVSDYPADHAEFSTWSRIGSLRLGCGAPCNGTIYVDFKTKQVSDTFDCVVQTDPVRRVVAWAGARGLVVQRIFGRPDRGMRVASDVATVCGDDVTADYNARNELELTYSKEPDSAQTTHVISVRDESLDAVLR